MTCRRAQGLVGVKKEIAAQTPFVGRGTKPAMDLKKLGVPALIAVAGLAVLGGIIAVVNGSGNGTETPPPIVATTPSDTDLPTVETATEPAAATQTEPTGKIIFSCEFQGTEICIINAVGTGLVGRLTNSPFDNSQLPRAGGPNGVFVVNYGDYSEILDTRHADRGNKQLTDFGSGRARRRSRRHQNHPLQYAARAKPCDCG